MYLGYTSEKEGKELHQENWYIQLALGQVSIHHSSIWSQVYSEHQVSIHQGRAPCNGDATP